MPYQIEMLKDRLYGRDGLGATNVSVTPGSDRDATAEGMAREVNRALSQIEAGDFEVVESFDD